MSKGRLGNPRTAKSLALVRYVEERREENMDHHQLAFKLFQGSCGDSYYGLL